MARSQLTCDGWSRVSQRPAALRPPGTPPHIHHPMTAAAPRTSQRRLRWERQARPGAHLHTGSGAFSRLSWRMLRLLGRSAAILESSLFSPWTRAQLHPQDGLRVQPLLASQGAGAHCGHQKTSAQRRVRPQAWRKRLLGRGKTGERGLLGKLEFISVRNARSAEHTVQRARRRAAGWWGGHTRGSGTESPT